MTAFYDNDKVSRMSACKRDATYGERKHGKGNGVPKRFMNVSQAEAFAMMKEEFPFINVCQRYFEKLRPHHVKTADAKHRLVCLCILCENMKLMLKGLRDLRLKCTSKHGTNFRKELEADIIQLMRGLLCSKDGKFLESNKECLDFTCDQCGVEGLAAYLDVLSGPCAQEVLHTVKYHQFEYVEVASNNDQQQTGAPTPATGQPPLPSSHDAEDESHDSGSESDETCGGGESTGEPNSCPKPKPMKRMERREKEQPIDDFMDLFQQRMKRWEA
jgi:hypothetical protein